MNKSVLLRIFIFTSILTFAPLARAEAALFDLVFMLPAVMARSFYEWLLEYYWWFFGFTALVWVWRVFIGNDPLAWLFGTDTRDGLLDFLYPNSRGERIQSPHVWLLVLLILATLYLFVGSAFIGFGNERERKAAAEKYLNTPRPYPPEAAAKPIGSAKPILPIQQQLSVPTFAVHLDRPENPANSPWPKQSGYLLPPQAAQLIGSANITLHADGGSPIYVKLCATANADCQVVRHIFAMPRTKFTLDNVPDGTYSLRSIEIIGPEYAIARTKNFEILNGTSKQMTFHVLPAKYLRDADGGDDFYRYITRKF